MNDSCTKAQHLPDRLVEAARHRRLVPFIGAGLSRQADPRRYPAWNDLLAGMIHKFVKDKYLSTDECKSLGAMLRLGNNPQAVAETIKARVPRDAYFSYLQDQYSHVPKKPSYAHTQVLRLKPPLILTTNYDKLVENAYAYSSRQQLSVVQYNQPGQVRNRLLNAIQNKTPFLFKLHGDIDTPSDIILTGSDYEKLKQRQDGYRLLLSSLFFHYTTLFIGFSLTDVEIMLHIRNVQEALKGERYPDYALLSADSCTEHQAVEFRAEFGIQIIRYKRDGKHHAAAKILSLLANQITN